ncbi:MAG TPA: GNAT family N-acetyltransferase [Acidimicrobiales bacterium]|nr:GNAT family N-acetyltransferase [Acidimicrobiales bacterium]
MATPTLTDYVAERDREIVGNACLTIVPNLINDCRPTAFVEPVLAAATHRRRGIGRLMLGARSLGGMFAERFARVRGRMDELGVDVVLLSVGPDLPWLTGYTAMPLERLTMLVLPRDADAVLVVPRLEAPRVVEHPEVFRLHPWDETDDPIAVVAGLVGSAADGRLAIGDRTWSRFLLDLQGALPDAGWGKASGVVGSLRAVKDKAEVEALRRAGAAVDAVAAELQAGRIPLVGRTEADISAELGRRILDAGHQHVNFAIVAAGENAASPHHDASERVVRAGEVVLCDFGGTMLDDDGVGYCSDITRCVVAGGGPVPTQVAEAYAVLHEAQQAAVAAAVVGTTCAEVDATARRIISDAGLGERFIHRTGHGIGVEEHEDPYIVAGNDTPLAAGHAFSIEPGIYVPDRFGLRLEDIVVASEAGPDALNTVDHTLVVVDA